MRKLAVTNFLTLDGVMQGPGHPDEDRSGGFEHGGWVMPYLGEEWAEVAGPAMAASDAFLLGRVTYEIMAAYWPNQPDDDPFAAKMNGTPKHVASTTLDEVSWVKSELLTGDVVGQVAKLKEQPGKDIAVLGSGGLIQTLIEYDLIDEFSLFVAPIVLGSGKRMFRDGGPTISFELVSSRVMSTGAVMLTYRRAPAA